MRMRYNIEFYAPGITGPLWINGRYNDTTGQFTFLDGTPFSSEIMSLRDSDDIEHYACVRKTGTAWRDIVCDKNHGFICERNLIQQ